MTRSEYIALMRFPPQWELWGMLPDAYLTRAISAYRPGHEDASEHDRNGAFHYWLRQRPSKSQLLTLYRLSLLEPDIDMAADWRNHLAKADACDGELLQLIQEGNV
jgi:hypothetical protein